MAVTRSDLRNSIRQDLAQWPVSGALKNAISATSRSLELQDDLDLGVAGPGSMLEIESEVLKVIDQPQDSSALRLMRGYAATTAAAHVQTVAVKIYPSWGWTDVELNRLLDDAVRWLKPHAWTIARSADFTWSASTREVQTPAAAGINYPTGNAMYKLQWKDDQGRYHDFFGWQLQGDYLRFRNEASSARTLRAVYLKFQAVLTDDSTALDNDDFSEALTKYTAHLAINALKANRVRFAEYAAALNDRASTPDELIRMGFDFKNQAVVARDEKSPPRPPTQASTMREL